MLLGGKIWLNFFDKNVRYKEEDIGTSLYNEHDGSNEMFSLFIHKSLSSFKKLRWKMGKEPPDLIYSMLSFIIVIII